MTVYTILFTPSVHLEAASVYSHHGAIQAAYRSLSDAEDIARDTGNLNLLARTFSQSVSVACFERDYAWAIKAAEQALTVYKDIDVSPGPGLLSNFALALLHTDRLDDAVNMFRAAVASVDDSDESDGSLPALLINLAVCLRRNGELGATSVELDRARLLMPKDAAFEKWVELELGQASLAVEQVDGAGLVVALQAAAQHLDEGISQVFRLHHRRGLREQYVERFEALLRALPERGGVLSVIEIFATLRGNALGDWLVLLEWAATLGAQGAPAVEQQGMNEIMERLRDFGAPHLFGFREKYDDAWQPFNPGTAWDDLSHMARRLSLQGIESPFEGAKLPRVCARLKQRLSERNAFITVTYAGRGALMWVMFGEIYVRVLLPFELLSSWKSAQQKFSVGEIDRSGFTRELNALLDGCSPLLHSAWAELAEFKPTSIKFLQDFDGGLPIAPMALADEDLAYSVRNGLCEIRTVPALVFSQEQLSFMPQTIIAINESSEDLLLPAFEGDAIAAASGMRLERVASAKDQKSLGEVVGDAEALMVSTHGLPLGVFTDAIFAGMNKDHVISVASLQAEAAALKLKMVILNACHSGTSSGRNF